MTAFRNVILVVLLAYVAHVVYRFMSMLDLNKIIHYHEPGPCHLVPGVDEGSEDVQVLSNGIALITSGLRVPPPGGEKVKHRRGKILRFDFNNPNGGVAEVKIVNANQMLDLNPHGISLWENKETGYVRVFIVNHPIMDDVDYICIFDYDVKSNTLRHVKSITHPDFGMQNDVVATGPESFYTSKYSYSRGNPFVILAEILFRMRLGSLMYFDGNSFKAVRTGLLSANGLAISPNGKQLYLAASLDRTIQVYSRNIDNSLEFVREIALGTTADNINVDKETGELWIGAHPIGYHITKHMQNPEEGAPSQVLRIRLEGNTEFIEDVYAEPPMRVYGSSSAERFKDAILVGTIQHKLLYCQLLHITK